MFKHFFLGVLFIFTYLLSFADFKKHSLNIDYRDTTGTYVQIFVQFADTDEMIKDSLVFQFTGSEKKADKMDVIRKEYKRGQPEIFPFKPGVYKIELDYLYFKGRVIQENKLNIITVKVSMGALTFSYKGDKETKVPNTATIRNRDVYKGIMTQACSEVKEYKKGNYFIEVNTFPPTVFITDINYSALHELHLDKPGKLVIDFPPGVSDVVIYDISGADWKEIIRLEKGYTVQDPLLIQPAMYKIAWMKDNRRTEKDLQIISEKITEITMAE